MLHILALEPYYGGSHKAFLDGYAAHSRHSIHTLTMPARKWKWRMRGAAITFHNQLRDLPGPPDAILASDYLDLAALAGMTPRVLEGVPRLAYFHENQLTYPVPSEDERDYQFGFTNVTTCLAADRVIFNSRYHLESFLAGVQHLLRKMPDFVPDWAPDAIRARGDVVPVGVDLAAIDANRPRATPRTGPLTVVWNHRWEYDKGAQMFFEVLMELQDEGRDFRLVVTGQQFRTAPPVFEEATKRLAPRMLNFGYVESRDDYCKLLLESDVVVSTAVQEFFGISAVEAIYAGCAPLLPNGLSYPDLIPEEYHAACLYQGQEALKAQLARYMDRPEEARALDLSALSASMKRFGWDTVAPMLDAAIEGICKGGPHA